jgi:hypothetical protein
MRHAPLKNRIEIANLWCVVSEREQYGWCVTACECYPSTPSTRCVWATRALLLTRSREEWRLLPRLADSEHCRWTSSLTSIIIISAAHQSNRDETPVELLDYCSGSWQKKILNFIVLGSSISAPPSSSDFTLFSRSNLAECTIESLHYHARFNAVWGLCAGYEFDESTPSFEVFPSNVCIAALYFHRYPWVSLVVCDLWCRWRASFYILLSVF